MNNFVEQYINKLSDDNTQANQFLKELYTRLDAEYDSVNNIHGAFGEFCAEHGTNKEEIMEYYNSDPEEFDLLGELQELAEDYSPGNWLNTFWFQCSYILLQDILGFEEPY